MIVKTISAYWQTQTLLLEQTQKYLKKNDLYPTCYNTTLLGAKILTICLIITFASFYYSQHELRFGYHDLKVLSTAKVFFGPVTAYIFGAFWERQLLSAVDNLSQGYISLDNKKLEGFTQLRIVYTWSAFLKLIKPFVDITVMAIPITIILFPQLKIWNYCQQWFLPLSISVLLFYIDFILIYAIALKNRTLLWHNLSKKQELMYRISKLIKLWAERKQKQLTTPTAKSRWESG